jgi:hypothetical protein
MAPVSKRWQTTFAHNPEYRNYFEVALALGMPVETLLRTVSSHELTAWIIFLRIKNQEEQDALENAKG